MKIPSSFQYWCTLTEFSIDCCFWPWCFLTSPNVLIPSFFSFAFGFYQRKFGYLVQRWLTFIFSGTLFFIFILVLSNFGICKDPPFPVIIHSDHFLLLYHTLFCSIWNKHSDRLLYFLFEVSEKIDIFVFPSHYPFSVFAIKRFYLLLCGTYWLPHRAKFDVKM